MNDIPPIDTPEFQADLHANYRRLRESDPVHRYVFQDETRYSLLRYDDVALALRDPRFRPVEIPSFIFTGLRDSGHTDFANLGRVMSEILLLKDGDDHRRLRRLVSGAFTPRMVARSEAAIARNVAELLDGLDRSGPFDLLSEFAVPLPVNVIASILGVPVEDRAMLKRCSADFAPILDRRINAAGLLPAAAATTEFDRFLTPHFEARRREPRNDLLTALVAASDEEDGTLSRDELLAIGLLLLVAGHETTTNLIGNGVFTLLRHPEAWACLAKDPAAVPDAVEELLRFEGPIVRLVRHTRCEIELRGRVLPPGTIVDAVIGSANRDPDRFDEPDRLDLARADNRHLAFGLGEHFCLGASLARLEARVALRGLAERLPGLKLASDELDWKPGSMFRALTALPVCA